MTKRTGVDAWLERFFRRRAALANPASTMGGQLERLKRQQSDSYGQAFKKRLYDDVFDEKGEVIGQRPVEYVVCKDDSAAHNAAHRADEMFADHGADLLIWAALTDEQRTLLELQRTPVMCTGAGSKPRKAEETDPGYIDTDKSTWWPRCPRCRRPATDIIIDGVLSPHVLFVPIAMQRRTSSYRVDAGTMLGKQVRGGGGDLTEWSWMTDWEPARLNYERLGERLGISASQVHTRLKEARRTIAEKLIDTQENDQ